MICPESELFRVSKFCAWASGFPLDSFCPLFVGVCVWSRLQEKEEEGNEDQNPEPPRLWFPPPFARGSDFAIDRLTTPLAWGSGELLIERNREQE